MTKWGNWCFEYNMERMGGLDAAFTKLEERLDAAHQRANEATGG